MRRECIGGDRVALRIEDRGIEDDALRYAAGAHDEMAGSQLMQELIYYGISAISLSTTGSRQEGLRACTSFIKDNQYDLLDRRLAIFEENHPL